jgi:cytosine/adenosine deaminase-related metal-dependent hydrolase
VTAEGSNRKDLFVDGGRIAATPSGNAQSVDLSGYLIFPGFVNAHDHLTLDSVPCPARIGPRANSYEWIEAFQPSFKHRDVVRARAVDEGVRAWHGGLKNLFSGVTSVAHHDRWHPTFDDPRFPVRVLKRFGWSHSLGLGDTYGPPVGQSYASTPSDEPWFIHLAEGTDAVAQGELSGLERLGALGPNTVIVHGVGLTPRDTTRVIERGASVVWCPTSNRFMLGMTLSPRRLFDAGRLALGTDSRLTGGFDMLAELKSARVSSDLSPRELLRLATMDGARVLGLAGAGTLEPGALADFVVMADEGGDPCEALLAASRADLAAVVRAGEVQVADLGVARRFQRGRTRLIPIRLDGRPKLCRDTVARPNACSLEPGLELA